VLPRARKDRLTVRHLPEETLVYDQDRHKGHCLNATTTLLWRHCDGKTSVEELARIVAEELGIGQGAHVVGLALEQLGRRHLLDESPDPLPPDDRVSRRESLKKLALAAGTLPLILTVATKTAAQSSSADPQTTHDPIQLNVGVTVQGGSNQPSRPGVAPQPCRTRGQSCVAAASGQQGTCCAGLVCTGVAQNAGVCG
jgi:Coenzyme PQQ synthesis protein D (PqqD)